jgi:large subunit ribosomal protein L6
MRALLAGMVEGVSRGFERELEIQGVGYKAEKKGKNVVLHLGYSHPINFEPPQGIEIDVGKNNILTVKGHDKQVVGQVASELRGFRPPDSYKGKGVRYKGEYVRLKAGKTAQ